MHSSDKNVLNTQFGCSRIIKTISFTPEEVQLLKVAMELAKRENLNFSGLVKKALAEYIKRHYPGNPQLPLQKFLQAPVTANQCQVANCKKTAKYLINLINFEGEQKTFQVCKNHKHSKFKGYKWVKWVKPLKRKIKGASNR